MKNGSVLSSLKYVFTDVDGTLTSKGVLSESVYAALWKLKRAGIKVIPVSGGAAGLAVSAIRSWPIEAFVTESGATVFYMQDGALHREDNPLLSQKSLDQRHQLVADIKVKFPNVKFAADQFSRIFDIAIDHSEASPVMPLLLKRDFEKWLRDKGLNYLSSSIHFNILLESYSKEQMTIAFFEKYLNLPFAEIEEQSIFIGDSLNDEGMFALFENNYAVSGIKKYLPVMKDLPGKIVEQNEGNGFAYIIESILAGKANNEF